MENLEEFNLVEMKKTELQEIEGGFLGFAIFGIVLGYMIGDIIFDG